MASLLIVYSLLMYVELSNAACFGSSPIVPPTTNSTQIALIMNQHELQFIDLSTLSAWSLDLQTANETFSSPWIEFEIINPNNKSIDDLSSIQSQRYTTINDMTYILHPQSQSLVLYNATSHKLYTESNASSILYPFITSAYCITTNNTHLFVIGGMTTIDSFVHFYSTLHIYDINLHKWFLGQNMTTVRVGHGCNYDGNQYIYVYGGWRDIFNYAHFIERYSTKHNQWELFMDNSNVIGSDVYRGFSRQCISTTEYPLHSTTCVEYPNVKDSAFNGEISVVNHQEKLAMNTIYKMNNFVGMTLYDIDRLENNYSLLLLFGSDLDENAMYSLIDRVDGSMNCYFPPQDVPEYERDSGQSWIFFAAAILLSIFVCIVMVICYIRKKCKKENGFQKVDTVNVTERNKKRVTKHRHKETEFKYDSESSDLVSINK